MHLSESNTYNFLGTVEYIYPLIWFIGSHYTIAFSLSHFNLTLLTFIGAAAFLGAVALFNSLCFI